MKYRIKDITPEWTINEALDPNPVKSPSIMATIARQYYKDKNLDPNKEHMIAAIFNRANKIIGFHHISTGSLSGTIAEPREIFKPAIVLSANSIILFHNHPSGEIEPSHQDIEITKKAKNSGEILNIPVLDHIILDLSTGGFNSLAEAGYCD